MKIVVTGAGGFLGRYIAEKLVAEEHEVFNFSRSPYPELEKLGIKNIQGDIQSTHDVDRALCGKEAVFHVAAFVKMWGKWETYYNINVFGTENIIKACRHFRIPKLIYTSSPSTVFGKDDLCGVDETQEYPKKHLSLYARSKAMAERMILDANDSQNLCTVALRPHLIFGPRDPNLIPQLVDAARQKRLRIIGHGRNQVDVIYVENAADAHIEAFKRLCPSSKICGKAYFLGQEKPVFLWEFIDQVLAIYNVPPIKKRISLNMTYALGYLLEKIFKTFKIYQKEPPITRFLALQFSKSHYFKHDNAYRDLGYSPSISLEDALKKLARP
jgi:nucleoside-diphosphate-sugar epimerase